MKKEMFPAMDEVTTMKPIQLPDTHVRKKPDRWLTAMAAVHTFAVCLVLFLVFSIMGGDEFAESMGGDVGLWFLIGGLLVSVVFAIVEMQKS